MLKIVSGTVWTLSEREQSLLLLLWQMLKFREKKVLCELELLTAASWRRQGRSLAHEWWTREEDILCFVFLEISLEPVIKMGFLVSHKDGTLFTLCVLLLIKTATIVQDPLLQGIFIFPAPGSHFWWRPSRLRVQGCLPFLPAAKISALSLAQAQPRKHLQGQLHSDTFSASDCLALEQPAGSPHIECEWGRQGKRTGGWACHLDRRPQMTWSYCLRTAVCCFALFSKINKASVTMVTPGLPPQRQPDGPIWTHLLDSQPGRLMEQVGD